MTFENFYQWAQVSSGTMGTSSTKESRNKAKTSLISFVQDCLVTYPSSHEEDALLLDTLKKQTPFPENRVLAVEMRLHEKSTLAHLLRGLESGTVECCG